MAIPPVLFARAVTPLLATVANVSAPAGGFYLWPAVDEDECMLCARLIEEANVTTLPGSFLARDAGHGNPGAGRLRKCHDAPSSSEV